jgi:hypothetical protein
MTFFAASLIILISSRHGHWICISDEASQADRPLHERSWCGRERFLIRSIKDRGEARIGEKAEPAGGL